MTLIERAQIAAEWHMMRAHKRSLEFQHFPGECNVHPTPTEQDWRRFARKVREYQVTK